jgi:hypothetical protein
MISGPLNLDGHVRESISRMTRWIPISWFQSAEKDYCYKKRLAERQLAASEVRLRSRDCILPFLQRKLMTLGWILRRSSDLKREFRVFLVAPNTNHDAILE